MGVLVVALFSISRNLYLLDAYYTGWEVGCQVKFRPQRTPRSQRKEDIRISGYQDIRGSGDQGARRSGRRIAGFVHAGQKVVRTIAPYTTRLER
jgi:hypothetical protein